jgi:C4-dicarboxylate-specific signal transduction histidine kinase
MNLLPELRLRTSVILLLIATTFVAIGIAGSGILLVLVPRITQENQALADRAAAEMADRVEAFLADLEARISRAGKLYADGHTYYLSQALDLTRGTSVEAVYILDRDGRLVAANLAGSDRQITRELIGNDLSTYPLFLDAMDAERPIWSDKHLSALTGEVTLGLAIPLQGVQRGIIVAEITLTQLLDISHISKGDVGLAHWIIDRRGEVVADTGDTIGERANLSRLPIVAAGFSGDNPPSEMTFGGQRFQVSAARSDSLGWLFVSRIPAGLENPRLREAVTIVGVIFAGAVLVGILLAPLWAQGIVRPLGAVAARAHQIASGEPPGSWPKGKITEFNQLSSDLSAMGEAIWQREQELRSLNEELEDRVARRTEDLMKSNLDLSEALAAVEQAKDDLIQAEKLAALGRLVAGVAHEMNTPLGNGRIAITTLIEKLSRFERGVAEGLRRSELESFVEGVRTSTEIAERNLLRASRLISSFKQVAADRTSSRRRKFQLLEVIDEVVLTLSPSMKRQPIEVRVAVPDDIRMDSYPGELGQALTNMMENCVLHAFKGREGGSIEIAAVLEAQDQVVVTVSDDGVGMSEEVASRAFDPFFTTGLGQGGTGLGLFITHNSVTNVLGGNISLHSQPDQGVRFVMELPLVAPESAEVEIPPTALARPG